MAILDYEHETEAADALLAEYKNRTQEIWNKQEAEARQHLMEGDEPELNCFQVYSGSVTETKQAGSPINGKAVRFERPSYAFVTFRGIRIGKRAFRLLRMQVRQLQHGGERSGI